MWKQTRTARYINMLLLVFLTLACICVYSILTGKWLLLAGLGFGSLCGIAATLLVMMPSCLKPESLDLDPLMTSEEMYQFLNDRN